MCFGPWITMQVLMIDELHGLNSVDEMMGDGLCEVVVQSSCRCQDFLCFLSCPAPAVKSLPVFCSVCATVRPCEPVSERKGES
jgi:hypothetical protein